MYGVAPDWHLGYPAVRDIKPSILRGEGYSSPGLLVICVNMRCEIGLPLPIANRLVNVPITLRQHGFVQFENILPGYRL